MSVNFKKLKKPIIIFILLVWSILLKANPMDFSALDYWAKGDGLTLNTKSIQSAVEACFRSGDAKFTYINCDFQAIDDREIRISSPADVIRKRLEIIRAIWGSDKLPDRSDVIVTPNVTSPIHPSSFVLRVDKIEIPVHAPVAEDTEQIKDLAYLFVPVKRNNRLVIFNPGHSWTIKATEAELAGRNHETTITSLLAGGFDVLAVYMPHTYETEHKFDHCSVINTFLGPGDHPATYGLRFFLEPEIASLNYLMKQNNYNNVNMVGLSGGGWTTNLLAAIDDRIKCSFSVAGSMPIYYRYDGSIGDIEQFLPQMYRDIAGYPDLYVLDAFGKGRKQIQILNRNDNCCFGQRQHDPKCNYDNDLKTYVQSVKERLKSLGAEDHYSFLIDEEAMCHEISAYAMEVILRELKGKSN